MLKKLILVMLSALILLSGCTKKPNIPTETDTDTEIATSNSTTTTTTNSTTSLTESETVAESLSSTSISTTTTTALKISEVKTESAYIPDGKWYLTLVNYKYSLPSNFTVKTATIKAGVTVDARIVDAYNQMFNAAKAEGITLNPCSGYRSIALQTSLFTRRVKEYMGYGYSQADAERKVATYTARPGTSEHNLGLAIDFFDSSTNLTSAFESTAQGKWLKANAYKYGFIMRYPSNKTSITAIIYEPWHYRYVGVEDAVKIYNSGLCFEEYLGKAGNVDVGTSDITTTPKKTTTTTTTSTTPTTTSTTETETTTSKTTTSSSTTTTTTSKTKPTTTSTSKSTTSKTTTKTTTKTTKTTAKTTDTSSEDQFCD